MPTLRLTYDELGERIGRSAEAAPGLARRRRWRLEKGNDSRTRVILDEHELDGWQPRARPDASGHERSRPSVPARDPDANHVLRALTEQLQAARAEQERLAQELLQAVERAALAEGRRATVGETADALRAALADLRRRLDHAEQERVTTPWWRLWLR
jgi:hypothetical protein